MEHNCNLVIEQQQLQTELNTCSVNDSVLITANSPQLESDDVSDIRNHISPHTVVWDLASGEDCSVVIDLDGEEELMHGDGYDSE